MPVDIYGIEQNKTSTTLIKAHQMRMVVSNGGKTDEALVQNIAISYAQPVQILREVGSKNYYYFSLYPSGSLSISRLVGADKTIVDIFPMGEGSIWTPPQKGQSCPNIQLLDYETGKLAYTLFQCIASNLGVNTNADTTYTQENMQIMFSCLQIETRD